MAGNLSASGFRDGDASQALLSGVGGVVLDPQNENLIYFADMVNYRIRKLAHGLK